MAPTQQLGHLRIEELKAFDYSWRDMTQRTPEVNGASVVLTGSFNPTIFQPEWFGRQNLLSASEVENAKINILMPQLCDFETERFHIQVISERFAAVSKPATNPAPIRDLVLGAFYILEHTPLTALGLNRQMHFALGSEQAWHRVGDKLAPKEGWNGILPGRPGMRSLMIESLMKEPDGPKFNVTVQPSVQVQHGVYFEVNEHYPRGKKDANKELMGILDKRWEEAYRHAGEIAEHILDWATR